MDLAAATRVGNRYGLRTRIAGGGMGEVWRAHDEVLDRPVAVKMLHAGLSDDPDFLERFRTEARNAVKLSHANIAQVHDYGEDDGSAYLVMELVEGDPLSSIIRARAPLSPADTVALLVQAATALDAAHVKGIVHRDVKPANIVVTPDGTAKLTDFGIARALGSAGMTRAGEVLGTPQYLPPEAALGHEVGPFSDVYSLAVVAFEMLAGAWPFRADTAVGLAMAHIQQPVPPLPAGVPQPVSEVVHRGLAKEPEQRYASAKDFAAALQQALAATPSAALDEDITEVSTMVIRCTEPEPDPSEPVPEPEPVASNNTVHPDALSGATVLAPGQNCALPGTVVEVHATVGAGVGEPVDPMAFEVDGNGQALAESSFVFFNNPVSASGAVTLRDNGIRIDLTELPDDCRAVNVALSDDHPLGGQQLAVKVQIGDAALELDTTVLTQEKAVVLLRVYRRDGLWKMRNVMAGWVDGIEPLVRAFGIEIED